MIDGTKGPFGLSKCKGRGIIMKRIYRYSTIGCLIYLIFSVTTVWGAIEKPVYTQDKPITGIELTIYNEQLALVKDQRYLELLSGVSTLSFSEVSALLDPSSVMIRIPGLAGVRVLEQNFEHDIVNGSKLLQKYLGQKIQITDLQGEMVEGYLLGAGENLIIASEPNGGEVRIVQSAQVKSIIFSKLPGGLMVRPTLVWELQNTNPTAKRLVEVSYLTGGLSWKADYIATISENDDRIDFMGWVTLTNHSGIDYSGARLKLVAGDVHRAPEEERGYATKFLKAEMAQDVANSGFQEQSFFEYHLYTLTRPTTLKNNQLKQVELLTVAAVPVQKRYVYEGMADSKKVKVMLEFENSSANHLGMPLPKGVIRVQKADHEGSLQLIGEDRIDHTPKDEKVRIYLGNAFDIVGERIRVQVKEPAKNVREETYKITLRNHKQESVSITAIENISGWHESKIISSNQPYRKSEAGKVEFNVTIPAGGEQVIEYTVRYKL